jgi:tRNA (guanine-N(7)-)-methyltransferase
MRMRKKAWAKPYLEDRIDVIVVDASVNKGNWKSIVFGEKLHLEIGSGKGDYWVKMAANYPNDSWIGVEKSSDAAAVAVKKCGSNPTNMRFINDDAQYVCDWFGENEVDVIHLNFSDPWPKKGHAKRRLTATSFLQQYYRILADDGMVIMKTDNSKLFEYSLLMFAEGLWQLKEVSVDYRREVHDEDVITEYEANFMEQGQPIYRGIWQKMEVTK